MSECVDFLLRRANNVRSLLVDDVCLGGTKHAELARHFYRLMADLPPCLTHLNVNAPQVTLPAHFYSCWAPPSIRGVSFLVSLRLTAPSFAEGASHLAQAIREGRMPFLKELNWDAEGNTDPDSVKITDEPQVSAYSGLIQACLESSPVESLTLDAWFVVRADALRGLAQRSPLKFLHLDCAELIPPPPDERVQNDDSPLTTPPSSGFDDSTSQVLAAALFTSRLAELHVRSKWFRNPETCRLLEAALVANSVLRKLTVDGIVDVKFRPAGVLPAVISALRRNRTIQELTLTVGYCGIWVGTEHVSYLGRYLDDPLTRSLLELVLNHNLALRKFQMKCWYSFQSYHLEVHIMSILRSNRLFAELCDAATARVECPRHKLEQQRQMVATEASDDHARWRRDLLENASERPDDSVVKVTAVYLLLRLNLSPAVLRRIRESPSSSVEVPLSDDHIYRIVRRKRVR